MNNQTRIMTKAEAWFVIREDLLGLGKDLLADIVMEGMQTGTKPCTSSLKELAQEVEHCLYNTTVIVFEDDDLEGYQAAKVLYGTCK